MNKFEILEEKVRRYRWLSEIAEKYEEHICLIEKEKDSYTVEAIGYSARCNGRVFQLNSHRSIPASYILEGLKEALNSIKQEIADLEKDLDGWI